MSAMWFDAIQMFFLLLVTSVLTYLVFCWRKTSRMAKELDELHGRLKDLQAQNAVLTDRNAKFEALNLQLKTDFDNATNQVGHLNAELRGAKEQSADRLLRIQALEPFETQFIDLSNRFVTLETDSGNLKVQLQKALDDRDMQAKLAADKDAAYKALEERYNALLSSSNQLKAEMEGMSLRFSAVSTEKDQLGLQFTNLTTQLGDVEAGNNALLQNIENLHAEIEGLKSEVDVLNGQLNHKETLLGELQNKIAALKAGASGSMEEKARLTAELEDQKTSMSDLNALVEALSAQVGDLEMSKSNLDANLNSLTSQVSDKDTLIAELQGKVASLTVHLADKETDNTRLVTELEGQKTGMSDLNALVNTLSAQVGSLEKSKSSLDANLNSLTTKVSDKDALIAELQGKVTSLTAHLSDKETANTRLVTELDECRKKYSATAKELQETEKELQETEKELSDEERKLAEMQKKVALINFDRIGYATAADKDNLQLIKGIGPFIENKLNAIGIFTFRQIANFTLEDVDRVTDAIEFFPGRIERDNWIPQADEFAKAKGK